MRADRLGGMATEPRRRGAARTDELLRTTIELATEGGYAGLSIEAVARRAGVGKHTIYRRWPSMAALLLDALSRVWTTDLDYHDTGDVRADLREQFLRSAPALAAPPIGPVYRALIAEAQADDTLRATLHDRFLRTVEERTLARIVRAQRARGARGRCRPDVPGRSPVRHVVLPLPAVDTPRRREGRRRFAGHVHGRLRALACRSTT